MAWNDVPARDDPYLSIQAYYARTNILYGLLGPLSRRLFDHLWDSSGEMKEFRRSALVGLLAVDLIHALRLDEVSQFDVQVGDWFVHSGETRYRSIGGGDTATIMLNDGPIRADVRRSCSITSTARSNMEGTDDVSLVVGRLISATRFDLVIAGYREVHANRWDGTFQELSVERDSEVVGPFFGGRGGSLYGKLANFEIGSGADCDRLLGQAVVDTTARFQWSIENGGGWKLLYDRDQRVVHETHHQRLFQLFSNLVFGRWVSLLIRELITATGRQTLRSGWTVRW